MLWIQEAEPVTAQEHQKQDLMNQAAKMSFDGPRDPSSPLAEQRKTLDTRSRTLLLLSHNQSEYEKYMRYALSLVAKDCLILLAAAVFLLVQALWFADYWVDFIQEHLVLFAAGAATLGVVLVNSVLRLIQVYRDHRKQDRMFGPKVPRLARVIMTESLLAVPEKYQVKQVLMKGFPYGEGYAFRFISTVVQRPEFLHRLWYWDNAYSLCATLLVVRPNKELMLIPCCFASRDEIDTMNAFLNKRGLLAEEPDSMHIEEDK